MATPTPTPTPHGEPVGGAAAEAAAEHPVDVVFSNPDFEAAALALPKREEAWFVDSLYGSDEEVLARPSVREMIDEEKLKQTGVPDAEMDALGDEVEALYVPGKKEVDDFNAGSWSARAGRWPVGAYVFPPGFRGARSGNINLSAAGYSTQSIIKPEGDGSIPHAVETVDGFQDALAAMVNGSVASDEDGDAFRRAPQAVYSTTENPVAADKRSRLLEHTIKGQPTGLKRGHFEVIMRCRGPGFRTLSARTNEIPRCCAAIRVKLEATSLCVTILEPCVHRAQRMRPGDVGEDGARVAVPPPEPFNAVEHDQLRQNLKQVIESYAVSSGAEVKTSTSHGALAFGMPFEERLTGNYMRAGGVTSDQVRRATTSLRRDVVQRNAYPALDARNNSLQSVCASSASAFLQRCDVMLDDKICVVMYDEYRVVQAFKHLTLDGGVNPMLCRGLVVDYAMKFVKTYVCCVDPARQLPPCAPVLACQASRQAPAASLTEIVSLLPRTQHHQGPRRARPVDSEGCATQPGRAVRKGYHAHHRGGGRVPGGDVDDERNPRLARCGSREAEQQRATVPPGRHG